MRLHLISVGALDDDGYQSHFFGGKYKFLKGLLVVAREIKFGSLYVTQVKMCTKVNCRNVTQLICDICGWAT
jgi:hypothetical protein